MCVSVERRNIHASRGMWKFIAAAAPARRPHLTAATVRAQLIRFRYLPNLGKLAAFAGADPPES